LLDTVGAIDDQDAERLIEAGANPQRVIVTGDTRYDQVWARAEMPVSDIVASLSTPTRGPTLVAGSTWPSDEEHLLPAWSRVVAERPGARLIIAPHEVTAKHLHAIETWARDAGLRLSHVGNRAAATSEVVLVDRYGILGDLYALADFSYVGGGFHDAGLHSLLEPAAFGSPVIIGPRHTDNRDARLLIAAGAAFRCESTREISARIVRWIDSVEARTRAGDAARDVVESGLGAAERSYSIISRLLGAATGK
jgi:3-deoxy-D-manno-octulosonic-acid transferase